MLLFGCPIMGGGIISMSEKDKEFFNRRLREVLGIEVEERDPAPGVEMNKAIRSALKVRRSRSRPYQGEDLNEAIRKAAGRED